MTHYGVRRPFATRWRDNDQYGHLNNVVYYEAMDTAVNAWMMATGGLDPATSPAIALVVASSCEYRASAAFPEPLEVGIGVEKLGTTSVTWLLGIFREGEGEGAGAGEGEGAGEGAGAGEPIATGRFVHVFVDAATRRPTPVPALVRAAVEQHLLP